ncbi:MAG: histidine phosphatase family protein [Verrucomicrobiia bacterium]
MKIFILRHAEAEDRAENDFGRRLTPRGWNQVKAIADFCGATGLLPSVVLSSPLVRARQTAEHFCDLVGLETPIIEASLASGAASAEAIAEVLKDYSQIERVMIVGHEPDLSAFLAWLLGAWSGASFRITKGSLSIVDCPALRQGGGTLRLLVPPSMLKGEV